MAVADTRVLSGDALISDLEETRLDLGREQPIRGPRRRPATLEEAAASRRQMHRGGANTVNRNGERYINCPVRSVRRFQLRKIMDEAGQNIVGGPMPSHEVLDRWESCALGLTDEEIDRLQKEDPTPDKLIFTGWWINVHRHSHWSVGIGTAFAGEGEKLNAETRTRLLQDLDEKRELYAELGVKDIDRALVRDVEHAGVDVDHAEFDRDVIHDYCRTPEAQDQMRRAFIMRMQRSWM
jgi:pyrroloquinoline quinone (PQQ) biosynthesis protein C